MTKKKQSDTKKTEEKVSVKQEKAKETKKKTKEAEVENQAQEEVKTEQPQVRKKLEEHMLVDIASGVHGGLTYISRDGSVYLRFEEYDDRDVIELKDLRRMMSSARSFLQRGWIRVLDQEVIEYLNLQKLQENTVEPEDLEDLLKLSPERVVENIKSASSNAKSLIFNFAKEKYVNGELSNIHMLNAIEEGLGESLDPNN